MTNATTKWGYFRSGQAGGPGNGTAATLKSQLVDTPTTVQYHPLNHPAFKES